MCDIGLVNRCTTESCHTSIRLSMCEEYHYDNTHFSQRLWTELCGVYNLAEKQCSSKYTFVKTTKSALQLELHPFSPMLLCDQQEEERWKEADIYIACTRFWLRDVL